MKYIKKMNGGFTLIELMVAIAIFSFVSAGIFGAYRSQLKAYVTQKEVVSMQQTLRGSNTLLVRELRMAGYNLLSDPINDDEPPLSFMNAFPAAGDGIGRSYIAFVYDADNDGTSDLNDPMEMAAYRLQGNSIDRYFIDTADPSSGTWETVAENIDALDFVYFDINGTALKFDAGGKLVADPNDIYSIEMTIIARAGANEIVLSDQHQDNRKYINRQNFTILDKSADPDNFKRQVLTSRIICRNLGF